MLCTCAYVLLRTNDVLFKVSGDKNASIIGYLTSRSSIRFLPYQTRRTSVCKKYACQSQVQLKRTIPPPSYEIRGAWRLHGILSTDSSACPTVFSAARASVRPMINDSFRKSYSNLRIMWFKWHKLCTRSGQVIQHYFGTQKATTQTHIFFNKSCKTNYHSATPKWAEAGQYYMLCRVNFVLITFELCVIMC